MVSYPSIPCKRPRPRRKCLVGWTRLRGSLNPSRRKEFGDQSKIFQRPLYRHRRRADRLHATGEQDAVDIILDVKQVSIRSRNIANVNSRVTSIVVIQTGHWVRLPGYYQAVTRFAKTLGERAQSIRKVATSCCWSAEDSQILAGLEST